MGDRRGRVVAVAGIEASADPIDLLAADLSPPAGLDSAGVLSGPPPPQLAGDRGEIRSWFVRLGVRSDAIVIGVLIDPPGDGQALAAIDIHDHPDATIAAAAAVQQRLSQWRRRERSQATAFLAGDSRDAVRVRRQVTIARQVRVDVLINGPGEGGLVIAHRIADSAEPVEVIDGSLMDAELMDSIAAPLIAHLTQSPGDRQIPTQATVIVTHLHETPHDAQGRLVQWKQVFGDRLRCIGVGTFPSRDDVAAALLAELAAAFDAVTIPLTPLAMRADDIPAIATEMLNGRRAAGDTAADRFSRDCVDALLGYPWPGDLQELDQSIRFAARVCPQSIITRDHLPLAVRAFRQRGGDDAGSVDLDATLREVELRLIREAVAAAGGNRAEAARRLNISRPRLLRRLDEHDRDGGAGDDPPDRGDRKRTP